MRREIEAALDSRRNIVPVMLEGFKFGTSASQLTGKLAPLKQYNGLPIPEGYFRQAMERLRDEFLSVSLDTILHPASGSAQEVAKELKNKATMALGEALHQPWLSPEELRKQEETAAQHPKIRESLTDKGAAQKAIINVRVKRQMIRIGLTEELWNQLPANPFKHVIRNYFEGRRNAWIGLTALITLASVSIIAGVLRPAPTSFDLVSLSGAALYWLLTIVLCLIFFTTSYERPSSKGSHIDSVPNGIRSELRNNEAVDRIFQTPLIYFFGFPLVADLARVVLITSAVGSIVLVFFLIVSGIIYHLSYWFQPSAVIK
jgi:hypothetical protein